MRGSGRARIQTDMQRVRVVVVVVVELPMRGESKRRWWRRWLGNLRESDGVNAKCFEA
jgi:hypothetical protein